MYEVSTVDLDTHMVMDTDTEGMELDTKVLDWETGNDVPQHDAELAMAIIEGIDSDPDPEDN